MEGLPWLPNALDHKVHSPVHILSDEASVFDLINEAGLNWNLSLLQSICSPEEIACIQAIPLYSSQVDDTLTWNCIKNVKHNIESPYHLH